MPLSILSVAYPFAAAGPDAVGGAEQVLSAIDRALVAAGHQSIVVAHEGSATAGTLVPTPAVRGALTEEACARVRQAHRANIDRALARWRIDVVHLHGVDADRYLPAPGIPALITLHLPPDWYDRAMFTPARPDTWLHCVSAHQHGRCPPSPALLPPIANGVDLDGLAARHARRRYALVLARICPEKNVHAAMDAGRIAGMPVLVGGKVFGYPSHQAYFREQVIARIDGQRRYIGPVNFTRKRRLLNAARCLLVPSVAAETSSLVTMEALACGTPVIAYRAGALPELIEHGRTGYLVDNVQQMAEAMHAIDQLDREACRSAARARFSAQRMTRAYFDAYARLIATIPTPRARSRR